MSDSGKMKEAEAEAAKPSFDFSGKRVLVTGATKGIGRAIAGYLARCGASVVAWGRDSGELAEVSDR